MSKSRIELVLENQEVVNILEQNEELINEASSSVYGFKEILKSFVIENSQEFIGENLDETYKNIRTFTEVAVAQYLTEITDITSSNISVPEVVQEDTVEDYL